jgi:peroxiredoxin-like protein
MHPLPHHYTITCRYTGAMEGTLDTADQATINLSAPKEFGGPGSGWSPEALFLNAVTGCIALTFSVIANMMKVEYRDLAFEAIGTVDAMEGKRMHFSKIELKPSLTLANAADESKLPKIWENTEQHCLVSNSLKTPVEIATTQL